MSLSGNGFTRVCAMCWLIGVAIVPARAGAETPLNVEVDCSDMTPEQRASIEARSRAELAMVGVTQGEIGIHCLPPIVVVEYSMAGVPVRSSSQHLVGNPDAWTDNIMSAVHVLLSSKAESNAVAAKASDAPAQPAPALVVEPSGDSNQRVPPGASKKADPPSLSVSSWSPESPRGEALKREAGVVACGETWVKPLAFLPGACALVGLRSSLARIALTGGVQWSASRVHDIIKIRHWQAGIEWAFGRPLWFALGAQVSVFELKPVAGYLPTSLSTPVDPSLSGRVGIALPIARERLVAGVGVRLQSAHEVHISGRTEFSIPNVAFTTDVAYEFGW